MTKQTLLEELSAERYGAMALATAPIGKEARWAASVNVDHDSASDNLAKPTGKGDVTVIETAGDAQYEHRTVRLDAAVGVAIPFGLGADPWPGRSSSRAGGRASVTSSSPRPAAARVACRRCASASIRRTATRHSGRRSPIYAEVRAIEQVDDHLRIEAAPFYAHDRHDPRERQRHDDDALHHGDLDVTSIDIIVHTDPIPHLGLDAGIQLHQCQWLHRRTARLPPAPPLRRYDPRHVGGYSGYVRAPAQSRSSSTAASPCLATRSSRPR